ncbi:MAG TPA: hypothetical protein VK533_02650, partial [Sphingomonas sp.]|nr:hypothetical protein [Sphingomonas sp.]
MTSPIVSRREALLGATALTAALALPARGATAAQPFSWAKLQAHALDLARRPYAAPPPPPAGVSTVTYDAL